MIDESGMKVRGNTVENDGHTMVTNGRRPVASTLERIVKRAFHQKRNPLVLLGTVSVCLCLFAGIAHGNPWRVDAQQEVPLGKKSALVFHAQTALKNVKINLTGDSGSFNWTLKRARKGQKKSFRFAVPEGRSQWKAAVEGVSGNETITSTFEFDVLSLGNLKVSLPTDGVRFAKGELTLVTNRVLAQAELNGFDHDGAQILQEVVDLPQEKGRVLVNFEPVSVEKIRRVEIKATDPFGRWTAFRLVARYVNIPHDDVVFETGKWDIDSEQSKKLDAVVIKIKEEIATFRKELGRSDVGFGLNLYIAGCTDTVGSAADNFTLSRHRAKAIAQYFKSKTLDARIFYEGYGESLLAVPTADNVPEEKNRRALYILTNTQPDGLSMPGRKWRPL